MPLVDWRYRIRGACVSLQDMSSRYPAQSGVTLIELLIVLAIGGVLALIAVPSFRDTLNNTRQSSALALLVNDMNQARGEAIKRNGRVLICARNSDGTDCADVADWSVGWVVCSESAVANSCAASTASNPNPLVVRPPLDERLTLNVPGKVIRFNANSSQGAGGLAATATLGGTWSGAPDRLVTVAGTGHISKQ